MSLESFLSAFKQLILENEPLPNLLEERRASYRKKFPRLNDLEVEDLAKIPPSQIRIYTGTIFRGELVVLQRRLPLTFQALKKHWSNIAKTNEFDSFCFLVEVQKKYPWHSSDTKDLVSAFISYLRDTVAIGSEAAWIVDLALLEATIAEVKRSPVPHLNSGINFKAAKDFLVQDILKMTLRVQRDLQVLSSAYNLDEIRSAVKSGSDTSFSATGDCRYYLISRNTKLFPRVTLITQQEQALIQHLKQTGVNTSIESFIEDTLVRQSLNQHLTTNELEKLFSSAFQRVIELEKAGAIAVHF
jgi:hypothetical protein